jgi:MFS family permease
MLPGMLGRFGVIAAVFRSPILRRLEAAYLLFSFGEWSTWVAVIVYAYERGGVAEAGVVVFVELAPSVIGAPAVSALGDRHPRARVLLGTYVVQAFLMAAMAIGLAGGAPPILVYALAILTATAVAFSRPVHASLLPEVVASPDDLTAANVVSGMFESAGSLIGPLGAGILIGLGGPAAVFAAAAAGNVAASIAVFRLARAARPPSAPDPAARGLLAVEAAMGQDARRRSATSQLAGGLAAIWADRRLRAVVAIATWATFLIGAMDIFYAVLALDLMGLGGSGVGFVGALGGIGAVAGSAAALLLVGRERLGVAVVSSAILFGGAIAAIAVAPGPVPAALLLLVAGTGSGLTNVGAQTLIQRLAGDDVMSRVFGVLQGLMMGATALGALAVPILIGLVGDRAAFAVAGLSLPVAIALVGRALVNGDRIEAGRASELRLLRGVPMLAPLSGPVLERLAACVVRSDYPAGTAVVNEGDRGDRFYVVVEGSLAVAVHGRDVRRLNRGDGFGEIALIRDVPRTATITAIGPVTLLGIHRAQFLEALTGQPRSRTLATGLVDDRLAADVSIS